MQEENEGLEDDCANFSSEDADGISDDESGKADEDELDSVGQRECKASKKRKFSDFNEQLNSASKSLRALKKLVGDRVGITSGTNDGILSNEDFQRIKELQAKKEARIVLSQHGFKIPSTDQLSTKRVDAAKLEANIQRKMTKEERLACIRAGREERGEYLSRTAIKQKKSGGSSNRQKEHKKAMPLAAKRAKESRSRQEKKRNSNALVNSFVAGKLGSN